MTKINGFRERIFWILAAITLAAFAPVDSFAQSAPQIIAEEGVRQFSQHAEQSSFRIGHNPWSEFLGSAVYDVGFSTRRPAPRRTGGVHTGTRVSTGSRSRYRYEGNRVLFHLIEDDVMEFIAAYRTGLEGIMTKYDYAQFSNDEQLAYWLNLYNAVLVHEIARHYPARRPASIQIRELQNAPLFEAKLVTVNNVALSLNDIRYGIVYRYWKNPDIIYGFWGGSIGGPNLSTNAYSGANVWELLGEGGRRYVNALRGVESRSGSFRVSEIYRDAQSLFPDWPQDLYGHLDSHANAKVGEILSNRPELLKFLPYDSATADFAGGEMARFGGNDNIAAVLTLKPEGGSDIPVDLLQNFGAPVSNNTMRGGMGADAKAFTRRVEEGRFRERREGSATISDVDTEDSEEENSSGEGAAPEAGEGEEEPGTEGDSQ